jgi:hypothetical protein
MISKIAKKFLLQNFNLPGLIFFKFTRYIEPYHYLLARKIKWEDAAIDVLHIVWIENLESRGKR